MDRCAISGELSRGGFPSLPSRGVLVLHAQLDRLPVTEEQLLDSLSADDQVHIARKRYPEDRLRSAAGIGLARIILARWMGVQARTVPIIRHASGKPTVVDNVAHFSISHSGNDVLMAFCQHDAVGVDVEALNVSIEEADGIERSYFHSDEVAVLRSCSANERHQRFLEIWTRREALLKARGGTLEAYRGVKVMPDHVPAEDWFRVLLDEHVDRWLVRTVPLHEGTVAAVALQDTGLPCGDVEVRLLV